MLRGPARLLTTTDNGIRSTYQRWCQERGIPTCIGEIATDAPPEDVEP